MDKCFYGHATIIDHSCHAWSDGYEMHCDTKEKRTCNLQEVTQLVNGSQPLIENLINYVMEKVILT